jgi:hypothetical protein
MTKPPVSDFDRCIKSRLTLATATANTPPTPGLGAAVSGYTETTIVSGCVGSARGVAYIPSQWNVNPSTGEITSQWTNPDGSQIPASFVVASAQKILILTGDVAATTAAIPGSYEVVRVLAFFLCVVAHAILQTLAFA